MSSIQERGIPLLLVASLLGLACTTRPVEDSNSRITPVTASSPLPDKLPTLPTAGPEPNPALPSPTATILQPERLPDSEKRMNGRLLERLFFNLDSRPMETGYYYDLDRFSFRNLSPNYKLTVDPSKLQSLLNYCQIEDIPTSVPISITFVDSFHSSLTFLAQYSQSEKSINVKIAVGTIYSQAKQKLDREFEVVDRNKALVNLATIELNSTVVEAMCILPYMNKAASNPSMADSIIDTEASAIVNLQRILYARQMLLGWWPPLVNSLPK